MMAGIVRGAAAAALIVVGAVAFSVLVLPKLIGWNAYVVTSGSMLPTFGPGSVVVVAPTTVEDLTIGDIVTFRDPGGLTTHRVVSMEAASVEGEQSMIFSTKGDANEEADPTPLDPRNIAGRAKFAVPYLGYLVELVKAPLGAGLLAALFLFVLFSGGGAHKKNDSGGAASHEAPRHGAVTVT